MFFFSVTVIKRPRFRYVGVTKNTNTMPRLYKNTTKVVLTRQDKHNMIVDAAIYHKFSDEIDNIELLSYTDENGQTFSDRFDHINTTTLPMTVRFIGGTGHKDFSVTLDRLTEKSMDELIACIE